jgi:acyl-coenzyme A thioesterase PaaI-like protein
MKARTLRRILNFWPPFLFSGVHVAEIADDYRHARVELRMRPWNRNYVGTHFGGSLFAMTDPFWMLLTMNALGRDYIVWDKAGAIEFVKPGRSHVQARFELDDSVLDELRAATADGDKVLRWFDTDVTDAEGEVIARVRKQLYVRRKRERAARPG